MPQPDPGPAVESLWQISAVAQARDEAAIVRCFHDAFGMGVSSFVEFETGELQVSFYSPSRPAPHKVQQLEHSLAHFIKPDAGKRTSLVGVKRLKARDWANAWKRHFRPMTIRGCLLIKPSWSRKGPVGAMRTVILDPGLSFGTGQHPTTRFCLECIAALRPLRNVKSLLDVGTGSGILAISAARLGYRPVDAIDNDPTAVRIATANARRNRVKCKVMQGDVAALRRTGGYDVVCANLTTDLLIKHADKLVGEVRTGGTLLLAGVLGTEFDRLIERYRGLGWKLRRTRRVGEWRSGSFVADRPV